MASLVERAAPIYRKHPPRYAADRGRQGGRTCRTPASRNRSFQRPMAGSCGYPVGRNRTPGIAWRGRGLQTHEETLETITHNPTTNVYATGGDWVHAIEVRGANRLLFISGTMGLRPDFSAPPTLEEQLVCV